LSEDSDTWKVVVKWLLDAGASIHADADGNNVTVKKPCNASVEIDIAEGKAAVTPRGVGRKVIRDAKTGCPLLIRSLHAISEFGKRILSLTKSC
jgi:hypothetical protein